MKILVTGAAGFLGSWLCDALLDEGHTVVGFDNLIGGYKENLPTRKGFEFVHGSIHYGFPKGLLSISCKGCDVVYHCAALAYEGLSVFSPSIVTENIVVGTVNVAVAAIRNCVKRIVNCSSMARYGPILGEKYSEDYHMHTPRPTDPYGVAKLCAEQQLNVLGGIHGIEIVHAVPHNIIGPRQRYTDPYRNVASIMINRMLQCKQPVIYGDGGQTRCFSFVQDVLSVLTQLKDCELWHNSEVFNVGPDEEPVTINDLARTIAKILDFQLQPIYVKDRPCEVRHAVCSSDKIRERFGYETKTTLEQGLRSMVDYIRTRGPLPFDYHLPIELPDSPILPRTWKERLF